jgi:hypothetical protein
MKLSSFIIGMSASACISGFAAFAVSGSSMLALAMFGVTLVVAQILYVALLVAMSRMNGIGQTASWPEASAQAIFSHQTDLGESRIKRSSSPKR